MARILRDRVQHPDNRLTYWCLAPTYSIQEVQKATLIKILQTQKIGFKERIRDRKLSLRFKGSTASAKTIIAFKSTHRHTDLVAESVKGFWFDEAARSDKRAWTSGLAQRIADKKGWGIFTTTPLGQNWIYEYFYLKAKYIINRGEKQVNDGPEFDSEIAHHSWFTIDNITQPLLLAEVQKAKERLPEPIFRREFEASYSAYEGQIYPEFDYNTHVIGPLNRFNYNRINDFGKFDKFDIGVDWGFSHPGAFIVVGVQVYGVDDEEYTVLEEVYEREKTSEWWISKAFEIQQKYGKYRGNVTFYLPHDRPEMKRKMRLEKLHVKSALTGPGSVESGIAAIQAAIHPHEETGKPRLWIVSNARNLIREIGAYRYQDKVERPVKEDDHALDALRMAIHKKRHTPGMY